MRTNGGVKKIGWKFVILFLFCNLYFLLPNNVMALEMENTFLENNQEDENTTKEIILDENDEEEKDSLDEEQEEEIEVPLSILDEIDRVLILNQYSKNMKFTKEDVQVYEIIGENVLVADLLDNIDFMNLMNDYPVYYVYIVNKEGKILEDEEQLEANSQIVFIGERIIASYSICLVGDFNKDAIVDSGDRDYVVDQILTHPEEEYTLEDAGYIDYVLENNTYETPLVSSENLNSSMQILKNTYVGELVEIQYSIHGLNENYVNGISGFIQYDCDVLNLENINLLVDGKLIGGFHENYFIYLFEAYRTDEPLLLLQFRALKSGEFVVALDGLKASMNGILLELDSSITIDFMIDDYGKGGIVETDKENIHDIGNTFENKESSVVFVNLEKNNLEQPSTPEMEIFNNDALIRSLEIKGYSINFDKDCYFYYIDVDDTVDSLELNVLLNNSSSSYEIMGNQNFQIGINKVILKVYALDGSTKNYVIEVNKKENKENVKNDTVKQELLEQNLFVIISIVLIIGIIMELIYLIFREEE